jgi:hypothetical protein
MFFSTQNKSTLTIKPLQMAQNPDPLHVDPASQSLDPSTFTNIPLHSGPPTGVSGASVDAPHQDSVPQSSKDLTSEEILAQDQQPNTSVISNFNNSFPNFLLCRQPYIRYTAVAGLDRDHTSYWKAISYFVEGDPEKWALVKALHKVFLDVVLQRTDHPRHQAYATLLGLSPPFKAPTLCEQLSHQPMQTTALMLQVTADLYGLCIFNVQYGRLDPNVDRTSAVECYMGCINARHILLLQRRELGHLFWEAIGPGNVQESDFQQTVHLPLQFQNGAKEYLPPALSQRLLPSPLQEISRFVTHNDLCAYQNPLYPPLSLSFPPAPKGISGQGIPSQPRVQYEAHPPSTLSTYGHDNQQYHTISRQPGYQSPPRRPRGDTYAGFTEEEVGKIMAEGPKRPFKTLNIVNPHTLDAMVQLDVREYTKELLLRYAP